MDMGAKFNILIADDEKSNLEILDRILRSKYDLYFAKTGQTALKRALADKPDLILLDVILPDMSGFDVLSELKKNDTTHDIPVIFITGLTSIEDERKGLFLGAVDYITKPFNSSIVKARVRTHLKIVDQIRTIEQLVMLDALTGIPNRRSFDNRLTLSWAEAVHEKTPISALMIDLDDFKTYNDTYGHPQGDLILETVANILAGALKRPEDKIFRIGGDEFAALLPNTDLNGALKLACDIRADVAAAEIADISEDAPITVTVSIGAFSMMPTDTDEISELIAGADKALYAAKKTDMNSLERKK